MRTVRLGKTELQVSCVGFGGIPIQRLTEGEAVRVVGRALDLGVTFVDTANGYTTSEERKSVPTTSPSERCWLKIWPFMRACPSRKG